MSYLQTLSIGFFSAVPRPGLDNQRSLPPGQTSQVRIELPAVKQPVHRGVSLDLESLHARILSCSRCLVGVNKNVAAFDRRQCIKI